MPLVKRKVVELAPPPKSKAGEDPEVFYLAATGEIFPDYETYANRLTFYNQRFFQCELTGKVNLTFFEASHSEKKEAIMLHKRFPEQLKGPVLRSVQFQVTGRLDNLVDLVFDRFKDRFFPHEAVFVELAGDRYYARIKEVFPPKFVIKSHREATAAVEGASSHANGAATPLKTETGDESVDADAPFEEQVLHRLGTNLDLGPAEANSLDDPTQYIYRIQLVDDQGSFTGSLMEASADKLSRDRLAFSKTILRKYIRDCVIRDASVGAPWTVKTWLADKYSIPTSPSDETLQKNELIKDAKLSKRKKPTTDGEESTAKKKPKTTADKKKLAEEEKAKEEERLKAEKKKNLKYPIEDLELDPISTRELNFQVEGELPRRKQRPIPIRGQAALPVPADLFEPFMMTYFFLLSLGKPLAISTFSLDDYEHALAHKTHEPACTLVAEVHSVLLNTIIRDGSQSKELAPAALASRTPGIAGSLTREASASAAPSEDGEGPSRAASVSGEIEVNGNGHVDEVVTEILDAAKEMSKSCEKKLLRIDEGRAGWESHLIGILARRSSPETFPRLIGILSHLTGIEHPDGYIDGEWISETYSGPEERYPLLPLADKIQIINFLCELSVMTKPIKAYFEECEAQITELRKEKVELGRERKKLAEERDEFEGVKKKDEKKEEGESGAEKAEDGEEGQEEEEGEGDEEGDEDEDDSERDELESESDELASDSGSDPFRRNLGSRQQKLRQKALQREAEEKARIAERARAQQAHRAKLQENRQLNAKRKKFDDEEQRLWKRDEAIEREFRKMLLAPRMVPLGKDRFHSRYWWFDGIGSASLVGGGGAVLYQTGRLFVQGASEEDWSIVESERKTKPLKAQMDDELGEEGNLGLGEWAVYTEPEQIEELIAWLRTKGIRENQLKAQLLKYRYYLEQGMKKRNNDLHGGFRDQLETRRSARTKSENAGTLRLPYMAWRNTADKSK